MGSGGHIEFDFEFSSEGNRPRPRDPALPFRILLLGDLSGRGNRGGTESGDLRERTPLRVDRDDLDEVFRRIEPRLDLDLFGPEAPSIDLDFERPGDFHPDRIFRSTQLFEALRDLRQRLEDPSTCRDAAQEIQIAPEATAPSTEPVKKAPDPSHDLVSELLTQREDRVRERQRAAGIDLDAAIASLVQRHVKPDVSDEQERLLGSVDRAVAAQMRAVLHHPDFKALEAAWRGVESLVRELETGPTLQVFLLDLSKNEVKRDLDAAEELRLSGTFKLLVEETVGTRGGEPWTLMVGDYTFDDSREDATLLTGLAQVAAAAGAPFVAAASPHLIGCPSVAKRPDPDDWKRPLDAEGEPVWKALRAHAASGWVGLILPRMLMRLPYGKQTEPVEAFDFEEFEDIPKHAEYLWGNPAFACARLLGVGFAAEGWNLDPARHRELQGLPAYTYRHANQTVLKPPSEAWLTDRAVRTMLARGIMPIAGTKGTDVATLVALASISDPPRRLAGPWAR